MTRLNLLIIVVLIASVLFNAVQCQHGHAVKDERDSMESLVKLERNKAKFWKDDSGRSRARAEVAEAGLGAVEKFYGDEIGDLKKDIKGLKTNLKNLEAYTVTSLVTKGEINTGLRDTTLVINNISIPAKTFGYQDKWLSLNGTIPSDSAININYSVKDSLSFLYYYQRNGWFRKPTLVVDAISHNPHSTITGIKNIRIQPPSRSKIGIGLYAGYGVSRGGLSPQVGIGVTYKLIEF